MKYHKYLHDTCVPILISIAIVMLSAGRVRAEDNPVPPDDGQSADYRSLALTAVQVGGEIGRRQQITIERNLLPLDLEAQFLKDFRTRQRRSGFVGLGMLIDAYVHLAAGSGRQDVLEKKDWLIHQALSCQQENGYLGMCAAEYRLWRLWDLHEACYLIYGLVGDYRAFGNEDSLTGARRLADYIINKWTAEPQADPSEGCLTVLMAQTGLEPALLALAEASGDARYRDFCIEQRKILQWDDPLVLGRWGRIEGHVYAYLARCLAQLRLYRHMHDDRLLRQTAGVVDFLANGDGLVITGAVGDHECWHNTQSGTTNLGETCASAYLLRVCDELLKMDGDSWYGDVMERVIYNTLFAAQSPDGQKIRYYTPTEGPRVYFHTDAYCCPNNYRRIIGSLPAYVYYPYDEGVLVNLYTSSVAELNLPQAGTVTLRQKTTYPEDGEVAFMVEPAREATWTLRLRIPRWCRQATLAVNGQPDERTIRAGHYLDIRRAWQKGDRVTFKMEMPLRLVRGRRSMCGRVAIMRGPLVYCFDPQNPRNKEAAGDNPRMLTLAPDSMKLLQDDSVYPGGTACEIQVWPTGAWYPSAQKKYTVTLTPFPDPGGQAVYWHVPDPNDPAFMTDELIHVQPRLLRHDRQACRKINPQ